MFKTIVWATDGSESADRALPYAKSLAAQEGAAIVVVHCEEFVVGPRAGGYTRHADEDEIKAKIEQQVADLGRDGLEVSLKIVGGQAGQAAHLVADAARDAAADLIVTGTRGHTILSGLLVGAVTQRLLHIAPCPVLAVPAVAKPAERKVAASQQVAS